MQNDGLKEQLDRIERNVEALRSEVREMSNADVKSGARSEIHYAALTTAVDTLTETLRVVNAAVVQRNMPRWWESKAAVLFAAALALLIVGRELAPVLVEVLK